MQNFGGRFSHSFKPYSKPNSSTRSVATPVQPVSLRFDRQNDFHLPPEYFPTTNVFQQWPPQYYNTGYYTVGNYGCRPNEDEDYAENYDEKENNPYFAEEVDQNCKIPLAKQPPSKVLPPFIDPGTRFQTESNNVTPGSRFQTESNNVTPGSRFQTESNNVTPGSRFQTESNNVTPGSRFQTESNNVTPGSRFQTESNNVTNFNKDSQFSQSSLGKRREALPRLLSGPVEKILQWTKLHDTTQILFEVVGFVESVRPGTFRYQKILTLKDNNTGPAITVIFQEIDRPLPVLKSGAIIRCVGKSINRNKIQAFKISESTEIEKSEIQRISFMCSRIVQEILSTKAKQN